MISDFFKMKLEIYVLDCNYSFYSYIYFLFYYVCKKVYMIYCSLKCKKNNFNFLFLKY